jgi:hypothetical protein
MRGGDEQFDYQWGPLGMFDGTFCTRKYLSMFSISSLRLADSFPPMARLGNDDISALYSVEASLSVD